jgi:hypothetical protein
MKPWDFAPIFATTALEHRSWPTSASPAFRLKTNNPRKIVGIEGYGLKVTERVLLEVPASTVNRKCLETKKARMGIFWSSLIAVLEPEERGLSAMR